jgi:L-rhamnono-1,4-lactonase
MCKPDLEIYNPADPRVRAWRTAIYALSKCSHTYVKISGAFSEMSDSLKRRSADDIFEAIHPWLGVVLATFGPDRLMFGSDWPVCQVGVDDAWTKWREVVERMCYMASLGKEGRAMVFGGTAAVAYGIEL